MHTSTVRTALRTRLTQALRERDRPTASTLRSAIAAIENAEAIPVAARAIEVTSEHVAAAAIGLGAAEAARAELTADDELRILAAEAASHLDAADAYEAAGRAERAAEQRVAAATLKQVVHTALGKSWG